MVGLEIILSQNSLAPKKQSLIIFIPKILALTSGWGRITCVWGVITLTIDGGRGVVVWFDLSSLHAKSYSSTLS